MLGWSSKKKPQKPQQVSEGQGKKSEEKINRKNRNKDTLNQIIQDKIQRLEGVYAFERSSSVYRVAMQWSPSDRRQRTAGGYYAVLVLVLAVLDGYLAGSLGSG